MSLKPSSFPSTSFSRTDGHVSDYELPPGAMLQGSSSSAQSLPEFMVVESKPEESAQRESFMGQSAIEFEWNADNGVNDEADIDVSANADAYVNTDTHDDSHSESDPDPDDEDDSGSGSGPNSSPKTNSDDDDDDDSNDENYDDDDLCDEGCDDDDDDDDSHDHHGSHDDENTNTLIRLPGFPPLDPLSGPSYRQSSIHFASPYILGQFFKIDRANEPLRHEAGVAMTEQRISQGDNMFLHRLVGIIRGDSENDRLGRQDKKEN